MFYFRRYFTNIQTPPSVPETAVRVTEPRQETYRDHDLVSLRSRLSDVTAEVRNNASDFRKHSAL
jgi:hypothetical protein